MFEFEQYIVDVMVDVLVLNYNDANSTLTYVERIKKYDSIRKILIVDNCSTDDSADLFSCVASDKIEVIVTDKNGGYGAGNNYGIRFLKKKYNSEFILLSNPDVIVEDETIKELEGFLRAHKEYAIVAPFMLNPEGEKQINTAFRIPSMWDYIFSFDVIWSKWVSEYFYNDIMKDEKIYKVVDGVSGSLLMMNVDKMIKYGMYDENIFLYCEEITLALKLKKAGAKTAVLLKRHFIHNHSVSISKSYNTELKKHALLVKSKLYVIKHYYNASKFATLVAWMMSRMSFVEIGIWSHMRKKN